MNAVPGDNELPVGEHLVELRSRMIKAILPIVVFAVVVFMYSGELLNFIWRHAVSGGITYTLDMNIYSPMELILTKFKISLMFALFLGIPLLMYEIFMFVGKGLYEKEKIFFIKVVPVSFILFTAGAALAYLAVVPLIFKYTIFYSVDVATPQISVIRTVSTIVAMVTGFGLIFQLPLLLVFALKMNIVKLEYLKKKRMIIYGALLAFALFVSPDPSVLSELIVALVLVVLFEFSLFIARYF
ncbi:MAG: twin-arginine translocase subunit TatC [Candidatus Methanoperedenaceae archaeon]|nr:twin-arginine translocase subunit TatC [Candidatus Methanoperedenaceae archaeon]MDW7726483.1 twin-arginine translocase subunit TatC [Candidatus Methanoperedens sp.]